MQNSGAQLPERKNTKNGSLNAPYVIKQTEIIMYKKDATVFRGSSRNFILKNFLTIITRGCESRGEVRDKNCKINHIMKC